MRQGRLAAGVVVPLLLIAGCNSSNEPAAAPSPSSGGATEATTTEAGAPEGETSEAADAGRPGPGGPLELEVVATGLDSPTFATAAPGEPNRLYITEQTGRIRVLEDGQLLDEPFLDMTSEVESEDERGLLSMVFHPRFASNGLFYVNYTDRRGDTRVAEYRAPDSGGQPEKVRELLYVKQPYANHNGGQLAFGPDGLLYVGMGDGGSGGDPENRAQDLSNRLGKLLRLDVDKPSTEWEMAAYGLRNPWRFSFDRVTGDLWLADVGQDRVEEVDFVSRKDLPGLFNFGWNVYEGSEVFEDKVPAPGGTLVDPVTEYTHDLGCSVTGGYVYRGEKARREAWGRYFFGDYCSGRIWSLGRWNHEYSRRGHPFEVPGLTSFGEDADGELYLLSSDGTVRRLAPRS